MAITTCKLKTHSPDRSPRRLVDWLALVGVASLCWSPVLANRPLAAQDVQPVPGRWLDLEQPLAVSLRGVSVVNRNVVWASGAQGTVLRSIDRGRTITTIPVPGAQTSDFRDVQAFDADHAILMTAGQPARFYSTTNGGQTWSIAYECPDKRSFFNAMAFWDRLRGIAFSDPLDGKLLIVTTRDGGQSWQPLDRAKQPATSPGEHGYAASGTCLTVIPGGRVWIGLGGPSPDTASARVFASRDYGQSWISNSASLMGSESAGIFSLSFSSASRGLAIGGDYKNPDVTSDVVSLTRDGGKTWNTPQTHGLRGYRSCVARATAPNGEILIACGPTGCDWSADGGQRRHPLDDDGFHALAFSADGTAGFAVGADGRLARWVWKE